MKLTLKVNYQDERKNKRRINKEKFSSLISFPSKGRILSSRSFKAMSVDGKPANSHENGLLFAEKYIPEELLSKIFCYCDHKTLLSCQLVCKYWQFLIKDFVWRKKAEQTVGHALPVVKEIPWLDYYFICDKKPFNKNLIRNHSGEMGHTDDWYILYPENNGWVVECPPSGPSLPNDPIFEEINSCFALSCNFSLKTQIINLIEEGFSEYILDHFQPKIKISDWYFCRRDCPGRYECIITLLKANETEDKANENIVLQNYTFKKDLDDEFLDQWFQFTHEFENYGPGLRSIHFSHGGHLQNVYYHGTKVAGACIKLER